MISYLSQPYKSTVQPYKENVPLIAQIAATKQNKYDAFLQSVFSKQNNLLEIDTSQGSEEATIKKNNLLKIADDNLNKYAAFDLSLPENISKIENMFSKVTTDQDIIEAASITDHTKAQAKYFNEWKKEGKGAYSSLNENYFWLQSNKNKKMTLSQVKEKGYKNVSAVEYVDIDKKFDESIKELLPDVTSVMSQEGGTIYYQNGKILSKQEILKKLPIDAQVLAQAEINAYYTLGDVNSNELLTFQRNNILEYKKQNTAEKDRTSEIIKQQETFYNNIETGDASVAGLLNSPGFDKESYLKDLKAKIDDGKETLKNYQVKENEYNDELNRHEKNYGFVDGVYTKEFEEDELTNLRTNVWLNGMINQYADAVAYEESSIKVEYDQIYLKNLEHLHELEQDKQKLENDKNLKEFEAQLGQTYGTSDNPNLTNLNDEIKMNEFGVTTSDEKVGTLKLEDNNEYQSLKEHYGKVITAQDNLIAQSLSAYNGTTGKNLTSKEDLATEAAIATQYLLEYNNLSEDQKATATLKNEGGITYQTYFNLDKTKILLEYNQKMSEYNNERKANQSILSDIENEAFNLLGLEENKSLVTKLKVPVSKNSSFTTWKEIAIPPKYIKKYLTKTLSLKEINEIMLRNPLDLEKNGTILNQTDNKTIFFNSVEDFYNADRYAPDNYNPFKKDTINKFKENANKVAKKYQEGYLVDSYFLKDDTSGKGKAISTYLKSYINAGLGVGNENIILKDLKKVDGEWNVYYKTKSKNKQGVEVISGLTPLGLNAQIQDDLGLDLIQDVSYVEKSINKQLKGNSTAIPQVDYSYLGNNFVITKRGNIYYAYNQKTNTPAIAQNPSLSAIISAIKLKYRI